MWGLPDGQGQLVLDWMWQEQLHEIFNAITNNETICIFTVGTDSGGQLWKRILSIKHFCKKIILSVNLEVENSKQPALRVIRELIPAHTDLEKKLVIGASDKTKSLIQFTPEKFKTEMSVQGHDYS